PHILYGNDRLIGKSFQQCDVAVGEGPGLCARHYDRSDRGAVSQHWDADRTASTDRTSQFLKLQLLLLVEIGHLDYGALKDRPAHEQSSAGACWKHISYRLERLASVVMCRSPMDQFAVEAIKCTEEPIAEFNGALDDRIEYRLYVGRRT